MLLAAVYLSTPCAGRAAAEGERHAAWRGQCRPVSCAQRVNRLRQLLHAGALTLEVRPQLG